MWSYFYLILKIEFICRYEKNIKQLSNKFRDQPQKPLERAIWWMEWVLRNQNNTDVLKSPILEYNILQKQGVDIIAFILIMILSILIGFFKICYFGLIKKKKHQNKKAQSKKDN